MKLIPENPYRKSNRELIEFVSEKLEKDVAFGMMKMANRRAGLLHGLLIAENFVDPHIPIGLTVKKQPKFLGIFHVADKYEHYTCWALRKSKEYLEKQNQIV